MIFSTLNSKFRKKRLANMILWGITLTRKADGDYVPSRIIWGERRKLLQEMLENRSIIVKGERLFDCKRSRRKLIPWWWLNWNIIHNNEEKVIFRWYNFLPCSWTNETSTQKMCPRVFKCVFDESCGWEANSSKSRETMALQLLNQFPQKHLPELFQKKGVPFFIQQHKTGR